MKRYFVLFSLVMVMLMSFAGISSAQTTNATGTVVASYLNVRDAPSVNATRIAVLQSGYSAGLIGKTSDGSWYQIILQGGSGWVSGQYLQITNAHTVPVVASSSTSQTEVFYGFVNTGALNVRSVPSAVDNTPLTFVLRNTRLGILGRNADNSWFKVRTPDSVEGWVRSRYLDLPAADPIIPILDAVTPSMQVTGYVNTGALNVRSAPSAVNNIPLRYILRNTTVSIVGRTGDLQWYQVIVDGTTGWVRGKYITVTNGNLSNTPITG